MSVSILNRKLKHSLLFLLLLICTVFVFRNTVLLPQEVAIHSLDKTAVFNPRRTIHSVFRHINTYTQTHKVNHPLMNSLSLGSDTGITFHWDDWVQIGNSPLLQSLKFTFPEGGCSQAATRFGNSESIFDTTETSKLRARTNLYCSKEHPLRIVLSTDRSLITVQVNGRARADLHSLNSSITKPEAIREMILAERKGDSIERNKFISFKQYARPQKKIDIGPSEFIFDMESKFFEIKRNYNSKGITVSEKRLLDNFEYVSANKESTKYFQYSYDRNGLAYPFARDAVDDRELKSIMQHMIRTWSKFADTNGYATWLNHGSLLGWSLDGSFHPTDTHLELQIPITQLIQLGKDFNRTLLVENPRYGNGRYLLEVNPQILSPAVLKNSIDARLIDIDTGVYIDIKALSHTSLAPPKSLVKQYKPNSPPIMPVNSKDGKFHSLEKLLPLRHTFFEGGAMYVPYNVTASLAPMYGANYRGTTKLNKYNYQKDIHTWVPNSVCDRAPPMKSRLDKQTIPHLSLKGACNDPAVQDEFLITSGSFQRHSEYVLNPDLSGDYDVAQVSELPYTRKDPWDYYNDLTHGLVNNENWYIGSS